MIDPNDYINRKVITQNNKYICISNDLFGRQSKRYTQ